MSSFSPKYAILWFIPMIDLHWTIPQSSSNDDNNTGGKTFIADNTKMKNKILNITYFR